MEFDKCPICLNEIKNEKKTLNCICKKDYHTNCINKWLKNNNSCPCCRFIVKKEYYELKETDIFIGFYLFLLLILWVNLVFSKNLNNKNKYKIKNY